MTVEQLAVVNVLLTIVTVLVLKHHYSNYSFNEKAKHKELAIMTNTYTDMPQDEFFALEETAATTMESETDFLQLCKHPLVTENLYELCAVNYKLFTKEQKILLRAADGKEQEDILRTIKYVLETSQIITMKDGTAYLSVAYSLRLYMANRDGWMLEFRELEACHESND